MSVAAYKFNAEDRPQIPGAFWEGGHPCGAPNTPLPGLPKVVYSYMPVDYYRRRTYESNDHGWVEVKNRRSSKEGWRGSRKGNKSHSPAKPTMDELIISLGGKSYLIAST